ncbi:MAG TPA: aminotransferase class IV [Gemmatimonadota bacterium]|jgi:branched-subunit amino acid aminotransferase/4-amino-4-deoxychorismate lyase
MLVFLDGEYVPAERARVPADDPGFLYGDAVYETVLIRKGRPPFWEEHWARLRASAEALDIELPLTFAAATSILRELVGRNDLADAVARIHLTGSEPASRPASGVENGRRRPRPARTTLIRLAPVAAPSLDDVLRGWKAVVASRPHVPFLPRVKHANRLPFVLARREAELVHAQEAILLDPAGVLLEGTRSSLFFVRQGILHTPALECGILAGVTREKVLLVARREDVPVNEGAHRREELADAEEVFLTFTSGGVVPVTEVDGRPAGAGRMGPVTARLRAAYERLLASALARAPALV